MPPAATAQQSCIRHLAFLFINRAKPLARLARRLERAALSWQPVTMLRRAAIIARRLHAPAHVLLPRHRTARSLYDEMRHLTRAGGDFTVHNYVAVLED